MSSVSLPTSPPTSSLPTITSSTTSALPSQGGGGGGGGPGPSTGSSLANSASLYLYTFLATLVLLLSVSAAIVVRSFVLRRRHRLMVEEAIRNGTWVPPTAAARAPRVDLSKKPTLWEAYLGDGRWHVGEIRGLGQGSGKDLGISTHWKFEHSKDWESIKPVCADYIPSGTSVPDSASTPNLTLSPPVPVPVRAPITTLAPASSSRDEENQRTAQASTSPSVLSRVKMFLNPPPPMFPLPVSSASATDLNRDVPTNISMTELRSSPPTTMRVAVLIAMPSPPPSHGSSTALSTSLSSSTSSSNYKLMTSHLLQTPPPQTLRATDDEEHPLPQLEMGVVEVVVGPSESSAGWDSARRREEKTSYSRGSSYAEP